MKSIVCRRLEAYEWAFPGIVGYMGIEIPGFSLAAGGAGPMGQEQGCRAKSYDSDLFALRQPDWEPVFHASESVNATGMAIQRFNRRVLIVDDEIAIGDTLGLIFRAEHYDVRVSYTAERAIEVISTWRPDLAILDVMLPGMNGIDLAIVIKANHPACQVLLFSGHAKTTTLLEEAGKRGYQFEVLAKPMHPTQMLERVSQLLAGSSEPAYD